MVTDTKTQTRITEEQIRQIVRDEMESKIKNVLPALVDLIKTVTSSVSTDSKPHRQ
jgi:hypothetical protein